jgi:ribosome-associated protein
LAEKVKLEAILTWLGEKKAENISVYDVAKTSTYTDYLVVCEGSADLHNKAIASHLLDMAKEHKLQVIGTAGLEYGQWILVDIGDVIVHIFHPEKRQYYKIDSLFEELANRIPEESPHD